MLRLAPAEADRRADWLAALGDFDTRSARALKEEGDRGVHFATLLGRPLVLKHWRARGLVDRLKSRFAASRAYRHWSGAQTLAQLGIPTAEPLFIASRTGLGGQNEEWLAMEALPGKTVLDHLADADLTPAQERAVAAALGRMLSRLHLARWFNRDHKPSNLIVTRPGGAGRVAEVAIIDCVAIQRHRGTSPTATLVRMLASLLIEPLGCAVAPRRSLRRRVLREALKASWEADSERADPNHPLGFDEWERGSARALWKMVADRLAAHGDPRPAVDPLARPPARR